MRSSTRRALILATLSATALAWSGCEPKKQTEYIAGVSTQVQVPRDLKAIRIDVSVGGVIQFCRAYRVYDGRVQLPRSLGQFPSSGKPGADPLTVTVSGFTEEFSESTGRSVFDNCTSVAPKVGDPDQGTRILRRSRQPYVEGEILFLPMPLKYSCFDVKGCDAEDKTCKAGRCVDAVTNEGRLPKFKEELIDGTGGGCFSASACFSAGVPAVVVNADDCTYAVPNSPSAPKQAEGAPPNPFAKGGDGLNVEVTYDGGLNREILDRDDEEGFSIPDPAKPQQFKLAPGLCDLVKGYGPPDATYPEGVPLEHRITAVRVASTCRAKGQFEPLCAPDQNAAMGLDVNGVSTNPTAPAACKATELKPPKAALLVLADDTHNSDLFYSGAAQSTFGLQLSDPAFQKTEIGLSLFPGAGTCATPNTFVPVVAPQLARLAKTAIADQFGLLAANGGALLKPEGTPVFLDGALRDAYAFLGGAAYADYYRRAVLVLGNRGFDQSTCGGQTPTQRAVAARTTSKVDTYVLMIARDSAVDDPSAPVAGFDDLRTALGDDHVKDARTSIAPAQQTFQSIVNDIATCAYDVTDPAKRPKDGDTLTYTDPIDPAAPTASLSFNAACTTEGIGGAGFGIDATNPRRTYLCKESCDAYRTVLRNASLYAAQNSQVAIAVPIFAHKSGCAPRAGKTSTGQPSDGG